MIIAIKVGGSVFCPSEKPDAVFVGKLEKILIELSMKHKLLVVIGGGKLARRMIEDERARNKEASIDELHSIGIKAARMNASVLIDELGDSAFEKVPRDVDEVKDSFSHGKIVVVGGFKPGQTTDAVTVQSAEAINAELIIIGTDVKGVYDKDPKRHEDAAFIEEISPSGLREMVERDGMEPGKSTIVDPVAARLIEKTKAKAMVLDIRDTENLMKAIDGEGFIGTTIR